MSARTSPDDTTADEERPHVGACLNITGNTAVLLINVGDGWRRVFEVPTDDGRFHMTGGEGIYDAPPDPFPCLTFEALHEHGICPKNCPEHRPPADPTGDRP